MKINIVFAYYNPNKFTDVVHESAKDNKNDTLCSTWYLLDNGEFLHSDDEYESDLAKHFYGIDINKVTCKRCLKLIAKANDFVI